MRNIILTSGAIIVLMVIYLISLSWEKADLDKPQLSLLCKGNVNFDLVRPTSTVVMKGSMSLTTLGDKRLALEFSGQLLTEQGHFTLSRTLMMDYRYHPENHILELNYASSHVRDIDTAPEDVFFHAILQSHLSIVKLSQFSDNALLISDTNTPLYVCIAQ